MNPPVTWPDPLWNTHTLSWSVSVFPVGEIVDVISAVTRKKNREIWGRTRSREYARPRHLAMFLTRELNPDMSLPEIGRRFDRDHSTVLMGIRRVRKHLVWDDELRALCIKVCEILEVRPPCEVVAPQRQVRRCMNCQQEFMSDGPHNRTCRREECQKNRRTTSPFDPDVV